MSSAREKMKDIPKTTETGRKKEELENG